VADLSSDAFSPVDLGLNLKRVQHVLGLRIDDALRPLGLIVSLVAVSCCSLVGAGFFVSWLRSMSVVSAPFWHAAGTHISLKLAMVGPTELRITSLPV
jgi:hypothetical protein